MNKDKVQNQNILGTLVNKDESGIIAYSDQIYDKKANKSLEEENAKQNERLDNAEAKDREFQTTLDNITKTGEASAASNVTYNHNDSQLDATNVQQAVDKVKALLDNKANKVDVVFDISAYHATGGTLATYADLTAALGTNGKNIPQSLIKGGMSVKFVQTSDNKYVQWRLVADLFTTDVTQWQGVDAEPTAGSDNLAKSGGVYDAISEKMPEVCGGNKVVIIGDSISTFAGYITDGYYPHYPNSDVLSVDQTWWYKLIQRKNATLVENMSCASSGACPRNDEPTLTLPSLFDRVQIAKNADTYIIALGTNDYSRRSIGDYSYDLPISQLQDTTFANALIKGVKYLLENHPNATIIMVSFAMSNDFANCIYNVANHFGCIYKDLRPCYAWQTNSHPTASGMESIASSFTDADLQNKHEGFYIIDENLNAAMKYDEDGLDAAKISSHFVKVLNASGVSVDDGVFDISIFNAENGVPKPYETLSDALGNNGANVPVDRRRNGMSIKFIKTASAKYVQYRLMSATFSTAESDWQGVDDEPTAGSDNLAKSGGVYDAIESKTPLVNEDGFHVIDENRNIGMKYDEDGLDVVKVSSHFVEVLKALGISVNDVMSSRASLVNEDGFFIADEELNIGFKVDSDGIHAKNILEYEIVDD